MLHVLHAADFHLDSPFRSLPAAEAAQRRAQQRLALEALRDLALEGGADLCLLAGDLFDSPTPAPETVSLLSRILGEFPCPVCISPGNHDYYSPDSPYAAHPWPSNVHIFQTPVPQPWPIPALGVTVYGHAFLTPYREDAPLENFSVPPGQLALGVFHGDVDSPSPYDPISSASLARSGLCYAALGHVHRRTPLQQAGDTWWAYPGCLQGRGFDELGDKGCYWVTIDDTRRVTARFFPLPGPRYQVLTLPLTGQDPAAALLDALGEELAGDYVRLIFTGQSAPLDLPALSALAAGRCRALELRDDTTPPVDLWARLEEPTLTGLFLQTIRARLEEAPEPDKSLLLEAAHLGLAALEGREAPP